MPRRVHDGIYKRCDCPRRQWPKCAHPWHFNFFYNGRDHRLSLDKIARLRNEDPPTSKTEAATWRDRLRSEIRGGKFSIEPAPEVAPSVGLTLSDVIDKYIKSCVEVPTRRAGAQKAIKWSLDLIERTSVPAANGSTVTLGQKSIAAIMKADVEAFREARRATFTDSQRAMEEVAALAAEIATMKRGPARTALREKARELRRAAKSRSGRKNGEVGINRHLARFRHVFSWAIEEGYINETPFKRSGQTVVRLATRMENARTRRLEPGEEQRLLAAAGPHLRSLIVAALTTGCRVGELLSLTWEQVRFDDHGNPRWIVLPANKTKTGENRTIPVGLRLRAELSMRRHDPAGEELPSTANVFGNEVGEAVGSIKTAWRATCRRAGVNDLHFHDLRREFASRLHESSGSLHDVQEFLGHANVTTTSRYLKSTPLRLEKALEDMESRSIRTSFAQNADRAGQSARESSVDAAAKRLIQ